MVDQHCYCNATVQDDYMLVCSVCKKKFHSVCLRSGPPSPLTGDVFFHFTCALCSREDEEQVFRMRLQWTQVLILSLYNLQLQGGGKCGYFRWREHICAFVDRHWTTFFGFTKKKTSTWHGTVAGTLSAGCPQYFRSGAQELKESGWWTLVDNKPPALQDFETLMAQTRSGKPRRNMTRSTSGQMQSPGKPSGLRLRPNKPSIQAAIELKERRSSMIESKELRRNLARVERSPIPSTAGSSQSSTPQTDADSVELPNFTVKIEEEVPDMLESDSSAFDWSHSCEESTDSWFTEKDLKPEETLPQLLLKDDETVDVDDIEIDPGSVSPIPMPESPRVEDLITVVRDEVVCESPQEVKLEPPDVDWSDAMQSSCSSQLKGVGDFDERDDSDSETSEVQEQRPAKRRKGSLQQDNDEEKMEEKISFVPLSLYEERRLLDALEKMPHALAESAEARRLRRKLLVRQAKRERNMPLFDLDVEVLRLKGQSMPACDLEQKGWMLGSSAIPITYGTEFRALDRYQTRAYNVKNRQQQHPSFLTRLIGGDDDHLENIISPYTARVLKPFIWRDYETIPPKLCLLKEIVSHSHRNDPDWVPPPRHPIDYSYVRPHHIPSVNAICREFFWPGIDLSECLQYPDFSCIALYRKMVIGFSFMIPDMKYNEAYISFIFTHPEWRNAGIATFMLYHLIQTCMGKDVTLHVSATNPALFLYQKFGFKLEEFILDFYDKYYPEDSKECKHSFFLRLSH